MAEERYFKDIGNTNTHKKFMQLVSSKLDRQGEIAVAVAADLSLLRVRSATTYPGDASFTPLHVAAGVGVLTNIMALLNAGANPWAVDARGRTPLHVACRAAKPDVAALLVSRMEPTPLGADAPMDLEGRTPAAIGALATTVAPHMCDAERTALTEARPALEAAVYRHGDATMSPHHPLSAARGSRTPLRGGSARRRVVLAAAGVEAHTAHFNGRRVDNEDAHVSVELPGGVHFSIVCDGHGGTWCAIEAMKRLPAALAREMGLPDLTTLHDPVAAPAAVHRACEAVDADLARDPAMNFDVDGAPVRAPPRDTSGTTAVFVLVDAHVILIGNVGDSRAVVAGCGGAVLFETADHKVTAPAERARIDAAGVPVSAPGTHVLVRDEPGVRDMSGAVARSFGDFMFKRAVGRAWDAQAVTAAPDVKLLPRAGATAVVIACDGLWDTVDSVTAAQAAAATAAAAAAGPGACRGDGTAACAWMLVTHAFDLGSVDNITATVLLL